MTNRFASVLACATLAFASACGSSPTDGAPPALRQADEAVPFSSAPAPQPDTTQRVPNMMGSGN